MNELFRFVIIRPPQTASDDKSLSAKKAKKKIDDERQKQQDNYLEAKDQAAKKRQAARDKVRKELEAKLAELKEARAMLSQIGAAVLTEADADEDDDVDDVDALLLEEQLGRKARIKQLIKAERHRERVTRAELQKIGGAARAALFQAGLGLEVDALPESISVIDANIAAVEASLQSQARPRRNTSHAFYQGHLVASGGAGFGSSLGDDLFDRPDLSELPTLFPPNLLPGAVPTGSGYARILGMGDLKVVREEPRQYELGEVAHIENIMAGEFKDRSHRRLQKTEETSSTLTERETEEERDLQSTERFQLSQEASEVIKFESKLEAGFNLSASYGPTVSVGANTSASLALSSESSKKSASDFSREVTERAKNRIVERVREERTRKTIQEIEETNKHGFDNRENHGHVIGVYRWVDKVMRVRLLNYGTRLLLEFVIPEPAAFFTQALISTPPKGITMEKPNDLIVSLTPAEITDVVSSDNDYRKLAQLYQVSDIEPPPSQYVKLADNISYAETGEDKTQTTSKKITIRDGYKAQKVIFTRSRAREGDNYVVHVAAASGAGDISGHKRTFELNNFRGELPISVSFRGKHALSVHVTVHCERTGEAFTKWQTQTYKALLEGYQKMKSEFDEQVAVAGIRQANQTQNFAPERNRAIERNEIKRSVISMLTGQHFDLFGAITELRFDYYERVGETLVPANQVFPEIDFDQAIPEGKYLQFFENAFEWTNLSYIFYPYFWGRKQTWVEKVGLDNPDPTHLAFLQAGAARVVAPVRFGYERVVVHYLDKGEIWGGDDVPDLRSVSAPYVDIAKEIREQQGNPSDQPVVEDEWDVKLPTSLVMLQADASLPVFIVADETAE